MVEGGELLVVHDLSRVVRGQMEPIVCIQHLQMMAEHP